MPASFRNVEEGVVVEGLGPMIRVLNRAERELGRELKRRLRQEVGGVVLPAARAAAPHRSGVLSRSVKLSVTQRGASVYSSAAYGGAQNYGGRVGRNHATVLRRDAVSQYMTHAVQEKRPEVEREVLGVLDWLKHELEDRNG